MKGFEKQSYGSTDIVESNNYTQTSKAELVKNEWMKCNEDFLRCCVQVREQIFFLRIESHVRISGCLLIFKK